jgi:imidazolonepropionase-like amidohydrolase
MFAALMLGSAGGHAETIAIVHAKAWTLTSDAAVENATIIIKDGKIASISAAQAAPSNARVIDAGGKPVTPGLLHPATRLDNAALLSKAGVAVAMSLDGVQSFNAGLSIREGAGLAVANGLPYVDGVRSIISAPARIWGVSHRFGTLEAGKDADIVIWDGDPLEPSSAPIEVLIEAQEVSLVTRQTELRDRYMPLIQRARTGGS